MLMQDRKPISVVATEVGYSNLSLFDRQFLRQNGLSPREFRKQHGFVFQVA
jgi:AraC-like DNA-binding protein